MKSIYKATAILSGSSIVSILLSLATAKVLALYLHPAGYGYYGLLQSFISVVCLVAGLGTATGIVRLGAGAAHRNDHASLGELQSAAWIIFGCLGVIGMALLTIFRARVSFWALGSSDHGTTIIWMGIGVLFTAAAAIQTGILNAYHHVGALAKSSIANTVMSATASITAVLLWRTNGVVPAVVAGGVVGWLASRYYLRRYVTAQQSRPSYLAVSRAVRALLRFGGPYTASMLIGTGVQLGLPMLVVHLLNTNSVGYYRAAAAISVGYLGFLMTAMGQDYYPRLSAAGNDPRTLVKLINDQHRLVMIVAVPVILATLALVPMLIPIVYSHKFQPAVDILEWQLIGDVFKFSSLTMSFAVLARCNSFTYFFTEVIGGAVTLSSTWIAVKLYGLQGLGISFLVTYVVYYAVVWLVLRRQVPLTWTTSNKQMMILSVMAALLIRILPATRFAAYRTPIALVLAIVAGVPSLLMIRREFMEKGPLHLPGPVTQKDGTTAVAS